MIDDYTTAFYMAVAEYTTKIETSSTPDNFYEVLKRAEDYARHNYKKHLQLLQENERLIYGSTAAVEDKARLQAAAERIAKGEKKTITIDFRARKVIE